MDIENELKKFNVTDNAIAELRQQYMPLIVNGIDDREGLKVVNAARKVVKGYRIDVDKRRKELNSDALEFQRRINGEAKRITALLEPIEEHLANEEKKINDEIERIKREKEEAEANKFRDRVSLLGLLGFKFDGIKYATEYLDTFNDERIEIATLHVKQWDDKAWQDFIDNAKHYYERDQEDKAIKRAKEEEDRKALIQQRRELEMEQERLADIAHEQAKKEATLKAEAERLESLKRYEESKQAVIDCEANEAEELKQSFICSKQNVNPINTILPEPEFSEVDEEYQPKTPEEKRAWKECFDLIVITVMNAIDVVHEETAYEDNKQIVLNVKEAIQDELDYLLAGN